MFFLLPDKKKRLTKTCLDISSTFTEKDTWIYNSTPFTWTWNQVFMLLLKLFLKKKRLTKTCLDISSTFTEKDTWIYNSTPFTWTWNQVFMLLLKLFFKILRSKLAASILHRPGTGISRKLASQLECIDCQSNQPLTGCDTESP